MDAGGVVGGAFLLYPFMLDNLDILQAPSFEIFNAIPGVGLDVPAVIQTPAQNADVEETALVEPAGARNALGEEAGAGGDSISSEFFITTQEALASDIMLADRQALPDDAEEEDYGNTYDGEDDDDDVSLEPVDLAV